MFVRELLSKIDQNHDCNQNVKRTFRIYCILGMKKRQKGGACFGGEKLEKNPFHL